MSFITKNQDVRERHQCAIKLKEATSDFDKLLRSSLHTVRDGLGIEKEATNEPASPTRFNSY